MKAIFKYIFLTVSIVVFTVGCSSQSQSQQHVKSAHTTKAQKTDINSSDKKKIKKSIMKSLDKYAQEQSLAISNRYLSFGDYATGDAYTLTDDGEIQVSDKGKPGKKAFDIHNVVGAVSYHSSNGTTGFDKAAENLSNIEGYQNVANMNKPITKYLFADNGKVYAHTFNSEDDITLSTGFAAKDHNDKDPNLKPNFIFKEVKNETLTENWKKILNNK